jgi:hypothetical protein
MGLNWALYGYWTSGHNAPSRTIQVLHPNKTVEWPQGLHSQCGQTSRPQSPHQHREGQMSACRNGAWEIAKTWINSPPEQSETWLLARSNRHPFWHFHPDGLLYGHLVVSARPDCAEARFRRHPWPVVPQTRVNSHHGRVAFGGPNGHESAHLLLDASRRSIRR